MALNWVDQVVAHFLPSAGVRRAAARNALAYYEAAKPSRHRKLKGNRASGDALVQRDAATLRALARDLDRNHDLARGILNVMVRNVVGPQGIGIEPTPRMADDKIHDGFARDLLNLWREWSEAPCVSGRRDMATVQQLLCRSWLRDGDAFGQMIAGPVPALVYPTRIPMALELIESEFCPLEYENLETGIRQGIEINAWRQYRAIWLYKDHPGDGRELSTALKRVPAEMMVHLAMRDRISQLRGVSVFASVMTRLDDLKDYEESERIAARIAASMAAYVKKGQGDDYTPPIGPDGNPLPSRLLQIQPGMIFDDLLPGEEIGTIQTDRPNSGLVPFRDGQLRAVASGVDAGYSSISRNYNGSYSAQRQELVEQWSAYQTLSGLFISQCLRPIWRRFVETAVLSGLVQPPAGVRPETYAQADFMTPVMPWIDPAKEVRAVRDAARIGLKPLTDSIRERNGSMQTTFEKFARERALANELGLKFESDPAQDPSTSRNAPAAEPDNAAANPSEPEPNP